ncbi:hypothetical protein NL676_034721 [Syzygium grande]|nr:hypothetical protein NL676_034721 [Syzygium grande]
MSSFQYDFNKFNQNPPSDFETFNDLVNSTMDQFLAAAIISGVVGTAATVAVVYFLIDCLKKAGTAIPSYARIATNDLECAIAAFIRGSVFLSIGTGTTTKLLQLHDLSLLLCHEFDSGSDTVARGDVQSFSRGWTGWLVLVVIHGSDP